LFRRWRAERSRREQATAYVVTLLAEPSTADVQWLAQGATGGDEDHARWELRYARRAAGLLAARRDALDDRTASLVSAALERAWQRDARVAPERRDIAIRQFNTRLAAYSDALAEKDGRESASTKLARVLLGFAGRLDPTATELAAAGERLNAYLRESSEALRNAFGAATLPEDQRPSAGAAGATRPRK
jgi:hypothetical protein